jgi:transcription antitermination factor NusG
VNTRNERAAAPKRWYACYTRGRHEKRVAALLEERGFEVFLPVVPRERQWHDRTKVVEFPLFPSYVFSRFSLDAVAEVLGVPGATTIVRFDGRPAAIPDEEIANVRRFAAALAEAGVEPEPVPMVEVEAGEAVRVVSGPFRGVEGVVLEGRGGGRALIRVGLRAIRQGLKVEVDARSLQVIARPAGGPDAGLS